MGVASSCFSTSRNRVIEQPANPFHPPVPPVACKDMEFKEAKNRSIQPQTEKEQAVEDHVEVHTFSFQQGVQPHMHRLASQRPGPRKTASVLMTRAKRPGPRKSLSVSTLLKSVHPDLAVSPATSSAMSPVESFFARPGEMSTPLPLMSNTSMRFKAASHAGSANAGVALVGLDRVISSLQSIELMMNQNGLQLSRGNSSQRLSATSVKMERLSTKFVSKSHVSLAEGS